MFTAKHSYRFGHGLKVEREVKRCKALAAMAAVDVHVIAAADRDEVVVFRHSHSGNQLGDSRDGTYSM